LTAELNDSKNAKSGEVFMAENILYTYDKAVSQAYYFRRHVCCYFVQNALQDANLIVQ
jgi:hypothetical protein